MFTYFRFKRLQCTHVHTRVPVQMPAWYWGWLNTKPLLLRQGFVPGEYWKYILELFIQQHASLPQALMKAGTSWPKLTSSLWAFLKWGESNQVEGCSQPAILILSPLWNETLSRRLIMSSWVSIREISHIGTLEEAGFFLCLLPQTDKHNMFVFVCLHNTTCLQENDKHDTGQIQIGNLLWGRSHCSKIIALWKSHQQHFWKRAKEEK